MLRNAATHIRNDISSHRALKFILICSGFSWCRSYFRAKFVYFFKQLIIGFLSLHHTTSFPNTTAFQSIVTRLSGDIFESYQPISRMRSLISVLYSILQKHSPRDVLIKRAFENMEQVYRRTPMRRYDFNNVANQLYWNHTWAWVSGLGSCKMHKKCVDNCPPFRPNLHPILQNFSVYFRAISYQQTHS